MSYAIFHEKVDLTKAKDITKKAVDSGFADNRAMYDGDHWGGASGRFWVGPHADKHPSLSGTLKSELQRLFVCRNVIKEITTRHINPLAAHWKITVKRPLKQGEPVTAAEQALIDEAEALLQTWLDERLTPMDDEQDEDDPIQAALVNLLLNGRSTMRLFIPRDSLNLADDGTPFVPTGSLEETAKRIFLHSPSPQDARLWRYENSQQQIGIYADKDEDEFNLSDTGEQEYAEMTYLDPEGNTVLRIVSDTRQMDGSTTMDLGGRLTMHEMRRPVFVSPQLRSLQMALNMCLTMMSRNVVLGGYLERVILNGQLPGRVVKDKDGEERWVADPLDLGAGSLLVIPGIEYEQESKRDSSGTSVKRGVTNPDVKYREPVDVTIFEKTKDLIYKAMLEEAHQLHYLLADQAASSGEARKEAIADFVMDLAKTVKAMNRLYRWLLETVLAMTAYFSGEGFAGRFDQLRVDATTVVDTGRLSADDMRVIKELIEGGIISEETGMTWLGIQDTQAENDRKEAERAAQAEGEPEVDDIEALIDSAINNPPPDDEDDDVTGQIDLPPGQPQPARNGTVPEPA